MSILSANEAASTLKYNSPDEMPGSVVSIYIPAIDDFIKSSTGKDWAAEDTIDPTAKMVASILLVRWFDDPSQIGIQLKSTDPLNGFIIQLHAKVLQEATI